MASCNIPIPFSILLLSFLYLEGFSFVRWAPLHLLPRSQTHHLPCCFVPSQWSSRGSFLSLPPVQFVLPTWNFLLVPRHKLSSHRGPHHPSLLTARVSYKPSLISLLRLFCFFFFFFLKTWPPPSAFVTWRSFFTVHSIVRIETPNFHSYYYFFFDWIALN